MLQLADIGYRAGSLVFGGGHVVLPMLHAETVTLGIVASMPRSSAFCSQGPVYACIFKHDSECNGCYICLNRVRLAYKLALSPWLVVLLAAACGWIAYS